MYVFMHMYVSIFNCIFLTTPSLDKRHLKMEKCNYMQRTTNDQTTFCNILFSNNYEKFTFIFVFWFSLVFFFNWWGVLYYFMTSCSLFLIDIC